MLRGKFLRILRTKGIVPPSTKHWRKNLVLLAPRPLHRYISKMAGGGVAYKYRARLPPPPPGCSRTWRQTPETRKEWASVQLLDADVTFIQQALWLKLPVGTKLAGWQPQGIACRPLDHPASLLPFIAHCPGPHRMLLPAAKPAVSCGVVGCMPRLMSLGSERTL